MHIDGLPPRLVVCTAKRIKLASCNVEFRYESGHGGMFVLTIMEWYAESSKVSDWELWLRNSIKWEWWPPIYI